MEAIKEDGLQKIVCHGQIPHDYPSILNNNYLNDGLLEKDGLSLTDTGKMLSASVCYGYLNADKNYQETMTV